MLEPLHALLVLLELTVLLEPAQVLQLAAFTVLLAIMERAQQ